MSDRPSNGMSFDELRDEFDWMFEFQSRMAEYIRNDPDVHSLAGYVSKLEEQNAKLRELALGLKWCCENYGCESLCPLYDKSEQDHCREERLLRELRIEV